MVKYVGDAGAADLLVIRATLIAGAGPAQALQQTTASALSPVRRSLSAGTGLAQLAADLRVPQPRQRRFRTPPGGPVDALALPPAAAALVRALAVAEVAGAPAGPAVEGVLEGLRSDLRLQGLVRIRSAQAVISARFLIALPVVAAIGLALLDGGARRFLTSPPGVVVAVVAALLIGVASLWMGRLLRSVAGAGSTADPLVAPGREGADPVMLAVVVSGLVGAVAAGFLAGVVIALAMRAVGPMALRRVPTAAADGETARPSAAAVEPSHPGGVPTAETLDLLALALAAGLGLAPACRLVARLGPCEVRPVMSAVAARLSTGATAHEALPGQLAELAHLIDLTGRWGAPIAEPLRLLAGDLRDRAAVAAEEAAERLTVRLVFPTTLLLVPAFGLLVVAPLVASSLGLGSAL
ncbi:hypothetical protein BH23ACT9_BH23ACT9_03410 [soil metagenome]